MVSKAEFSAGEFLFFCILFVGLGILAGWAIWGSNDLDKETLEDICKNLTGNETVDAKISFGKLICETPSYDSTTNIIFRKAGET